jgi:hypothetical protein
MVTQIETRSQGFTSAGAVLEADAAAVALDDLAAGRESET